MASISQQETMDHHFIHHHYDHLFQRTAKDDNEKVFYFVRHGKTEANELLEDIIWGDHSFSEDPMWDTRLSTKGKHQAEAIHDIWSRDSRLVDEWKDVEIVLASPLTRTMQTTQFLFYNKVLLLPSVVQRIAHPILRERLFMTSDVGRYKHELIEDFPEWDLSHVPDNDEWWYTHDHESHPPYEEWRAGTYICKGEPPHIFRQRLIEIKQFLLSRPEKRIIVVAHWGVFRGLTGADFKNCEIQKVYASDLLDEPFIEA
jgi:broad specificity phosphatase PhoE